MNQKEKLTEATVLALQGKLTETTNKSKVSINNYDENMKDIINQVVEEIKEVLLDYATDITALPKKVNTVISCKFNTVEIPNKKGEYTGEYFEIPEETFKQFILDLKDKGYKQNGQLVWNNYLIPFNNSSLTGYVTLSKKYEGFKVLVQIKVSSISKGDCFIIVSIK